MCAGRPTRTVHADNPASMALQERSELVAPGIDEQVDERDSDLGMDADRQAIGEVRSGDRRYRRDCLG